TDGPASPGAEARAGTIPAMDAIAAILSRLPDEIPHARRSVPLRLLVLGVALLINLAFYLPRVAGVPGAGVPGADKIAHEVVFALTACAAGRVLAPLSRFPMGWVVIAALVHTVLIEIIQGLSLGPGRDAEAGDVLAGVIVIAIGTGLWIGERLRERRPVPETVAVS